MRNEVMNVHQAGDIVKSAIPPRSRLYSLKPEGLGTPYTESLTSYITRLAEEHSVLTGTLVNKEIVPLLNRASIKNHGGLSHVSSRSGIINGVSALANDWINALEQLTLRSDLRYLTLITWNNTLSIKELVRPTRAWCSACYEEWRSGGQPIYEPLLWSIRVVTACKLHRRRLQQRCPNESCHRSLRWLGWRARPGYCAYCQSWLGGSIENAFSKEERLEEEEFMRQSWIWENIGALIAIAPQIIVPPLRQRIEKGVTDLIGRVAEGKETTLARMLELPLSTMRNWLNRHDVPTLSKLLQLSHNLGVSAHSFLIEENGTPNLVLNTLPPQQSPEEHPKKAGNLIMINTIRSALEAALATDQDPSPSLSSIAIQLGYRNRGVFYTYFPELCAEISARYRLHRRMCYKRKIVQICEKVRQIVVMLDAMGVYPSYHRVAKYGVKPGCFKNREVHAAFLQARKELAWKYDCPSITPTPGRNLNED